MRSLLLTTLSVALIVTGLSVAGPAIGQSAPQSAPAAPAAPAQPAYKVTGFRSANFGMNKDAVLSAITRDFGIAPAKVTSGQNDVEKTTSVSITVPTLEPGPGSAKVTYVFGATQHTLMHVSVNWATGAKLSDADRSTIVTAGLQLVNYFRGYAWSDGRIAVGVPSGPNSVVLFAATDDNDGGVEVSASGIQYDRVGATEPAQSSPAPTGPAALSVAYTAKSKSPDIYRLPKGQF
jgi:hypothetical protein